MNQATIDSTPGARYKFIGSDQLLNLCHRFNVVDSTYTGYIMDADKTKAPGVVPMTYHEYKVLPNKIIQLSDTQLTIDGTVFDRVPNKGKGWCALYAVSHFITGGT